MKKAISVLLCLLAYSGVIFAETLETTPDSISGGKYLALPDISLGVQSKGKISDDELDKNKNRLRLSELELAVQGYVYPQLKADAFITMSPEEDAPAQVEEAYLTYLGLFKGFNLYVGKKHVAFGRTNLLHNHSWLYSRQPLVLTNLVAEESLNGDGIGASYLIPTGSDLFAQIDLGTWTGDGSGESSSLRDIVKGPGASFSDRFNNARLWTGYPITENSELELGSSYAQGVMDREPEPNTIHGHAELKGADFAYRYLGEQNKRLLLRAESVWRHEISDSANNTANGSYLFGNYRWDKYNSIGLLYDWSKFPQDPTQHESAYSIILTKNFTEQYYLRLQATHGSRPDADSYNEVGIQFVWGIGPHTHNLE